MPLELASDHEPEPGDAVSRQNSKIPAFLKLRSSKWLICLSVAIAFFTDSFLYAMLVPILPYSLTEGSGIAPDAVQFWISTLLFSYGACEVLASPAVGWLADRSPSRRGLFLGSIALTAVGTIMFMFGTSVWMLVIARCVQGLSFSFTLTVGLSIIVSTVKSDEVGVWMGFTLSGMNYGLLSAPFIAGLVYAKVGYYAVFIIGISILVFDFGLILFTIEKKRARKWLHENSTVGASSKGGHRTSSIVSTDEDNSNPDAADEHPNRSTERLPNTAISEGNQHRQNEESPLLGKPASKPKNASHGRFSILAALIRSPQIGAALYGLFISTSITTGFDAILPIFVRTTFHWNADAAGAIFLTVTMPFVLAPAIGALTDRYGPRFIALSGFIIVIPCLALLGLVRHNILREKIILGILLVFIGFAISLLLTSLAADLSITVEQLEKENAEQFGPIGATGQAYSLVNTSFGLATMAGPVISGALYRNTTWAITGGVLALVCLSGALPVMLFTHSSQRKGKGADSGDC